MKTSFLLRDITPYLREAYGPVQGLAQLQEGDESQAFGATVNGREAVIRIASQRHGFDKDNLAASRWPEVLAPEIIDIAPFRGAWLCLSARAPGTTLQSLGLKARNSAQSVCTMLDSIAGADIGFVSGFGPFDAGGTAPYSSWHQFIVDVEGPANWRRLLTDFDYGTRRALVHGDFGSNNVLRPLTGSPPYWIGPQPWLAIRFMIWPISSSGAPGSIAWRPSAPMLKPTNRIASPTLPVSSATSSRSASKPSPPPGPTKTAG